jgi:hypothetical protein
MWHDVGALPSSLMTRGISTVLIQGVWWALPGLTGCIREFGGTGTPRYQARCGLHAGARKWHRDREDRRMIKVAVYCNDVDADGGPLQFIRRDVARRGLADDFTYPVLSHDELQSRLGKIEDNDIITCTGAAGTVIFSDTATQYHRGKPAVSRDRCAIYYNYFSRTPRHPFFCEQPDLSRDKIAKFARQTELTSTQKSALLWRDSMSWLGRLMPPNVV